LLISQEYIEQNRLMHEQTPNYGVLGQRFAGVVRDMARAYGTQDVLDYGCGKCTMERALQWPIKNYDPCIPGLDAKPDPADIVVCTDVLEHIEPDCIDAVLDDLLRCTKRVFFCTVATVPAGRTLPDGSNTHKIVAPWEWWLHKMNDRWRMTNFQDHAKRFLFIGEPRKP
jgi:hypothetical protein